MRTFLQQVKAEQPESGIYMVDRTATVPLISPFLTKLEQVYKSYKEVTNNTDITYISQIYLLPDTQVETNQTSHLLSHHNCLNGINVFSLHSGPGQGICCFHL